MAAFDLKLTGHGKSGTKYRYLGVDLNARKRHDHGRVRILEHELGGQRRSAMFKELELEQLKRALQFNEAALQSKDAEIESLQAQLMNFVRLTQAARRGSLGN